MNDLIINEIQISPVRPQNGLLAFASCAVNNSFYIGSIAIYTAPNSSLNYRLVYPTKKLSNGKNVSCFYPYKKDVEELISKSIIAKYVELKDFFHEVEVN